MDAARAWRGSVVDEIKQGHMMGGVAAGPQQALLSDEQSCWTWQLSMT